MNKELPTIESFSDEQLIQELKRRGYTIKSKLVNKIISIVSAIGPIKPSLKDSKKIQNLLIKMANEKD